MNTECKECGRASLDCVRVVANGMIMTLEEFETLLFCGEEFTVKMQNLVINEELGEEEWI